MRIEDSAKISKLFYNLWDKITITSDGKFTHLERFTFENYIPMFEKHICMASPITLEERSSIISSSFRKVRAAGSRDADLFFKEVRNHEENIMRMPLNRFYLTTSISYDASTIKQNFKKQIGQSWITICPSLPKHLQSETWFLNGFGDVDPDNPPFYSKLYAVSYARTINQAAEQMLLDINLMVALLNISDPSRIRLRIGKIQPINEIRLGPTQIIHDRHGKIIQDKIWYQAEYQKLHHTKRFYPDSKKLSIWLYKCTKGISKSNIRDLIEPSLRQYNSALDAVDPSISLMKLWSALELLVNSSGKGSKVTAKRASFFSSDIEYRYEKLLYVSDLRNSFVHAGTGMPSALEIVYDLKSYIGSLLLNLILMRPPSLDKESFLELLDLPHEPSKIKRRISTSQLALRLRVNSARHA